MTGQEYDPYLHAINQLDQAARLNPVEDAETIKRHLTVAAQLLGHITNVVQAGEIEGRINNIRNGVAETTDFTRTNDATTVD